MEVLAIGTQVTIDGDIPATIRAVTIYSEIQVEEARHAAVKFL